MYIKLPYPVITARTQTPTFADETISRNQACVGQRALGFKTAEILYI